MKLSSFWGKKKNGEFGGKGILEGKGMKTNETQEDNTGLFFYCELISGVIFGSHEI